MNISSWMNDFVALLVITDPIGLIPIFLGLTIGMNKIERQQTALIAALISFILLAIFIIGGTAILSFMGISLDAFRIAGGFLLFYTAFEMLFGKSTGRRAKTAEVAMTKDHIHNIAAFPLAMPLIAGPGTILASIIMTSKHTGITGSIMSLGVAAIVILICYIFMLIATPVERLIGSTGRSIVAKLFGVLLAAMAIQFVIDGIRALVHA